MIVMLRATPLTSHPSVISNSNLSHPTHIAIPWFYHTFRFRSMSASDMLRVKFTHLQNSRKIPPFE
jgi:hypothetical protein